MSKVFEKNVSVNKLQGYMHEYRGAAKGQPPRQAHSIHNHAYETSVWK
jgi:hypothetical protein